MSDPWILRLGTAPDGTFATSLLCFPYAGAGASVFRKWQPMLAPTVAVLPVQLPGRSTRLAERPRTRLLELAGEIAEALAPNLDCPYALFGYSLGALVAFEFARELRRRGAPAPGHFFACARRAPCLPETDGHVHDLPDAAFIEAVGARYEAIPAEVAAEPDLMGLLLPALRADFEMLETYVYRDEPPLDCPITAIAGIDDLRATAHEIEAWGRETRVAFSVRRFPGGHFFFRDRERIVTELLRSELAVGAPQAAHP
jgi:medium-chain acyl-[acyl-carrier-protein] hydrolase